MLWSLFLASRRWLAACLVVVNLIACGKSEPTRHPDILLITIATLRADRVGCYGHAAAATPAIDRLGVEGTRYEVCVVTVPITLPAHAAILTGRLPARLGVRNNGTYRLGAKAPTLAEELTRQGFATGAFVAAFPVAARFGLHRGFAHYDDTLPDQGANLFSYAERPAAAVVRAALEWLAAQDRARPVFVWVHLFEPHAPYTPPSPFDRLFADDPYDGEVVAADAAVGELLAGCRRLRPEGWLTALTSDHGEGLGEHGEDTHAFFLYETTLRVPLILHAPGRVPAHEVVAEPVGLIDLAPTILALAGIGDHHLAPDGIALDPGRSPPRRDLIAETLAGMECCGWSPAFSLRHSTQKVIRSARSQAFDLVADPNELHDLKTAEPPAWATRLLGSLEEHIRGLDTLDSPERVVRHLTPDERRKLTALGYIVGGVGKGDSSAMGSSLLRRMAELPAAADRLAAHVTVGEAQKLIAGGEYGAAVALLEPVLAENPAHTDARSLLAGSYSELGRQDEALRQYTLLV